ncbi:MAG: hypothetical protein KGI27_09270 [Thaumarchaeota archaeon]|nr:hypothetical protein [Nitrososphaerota archaeon]
MKIKFDPVVKRETTSIKIDPSVWKEAKKDAIDRDIDLSQLVEIALKTWLEDEDPKKIKNGLREKT